MQRLLGVLFSGCIGANLRSAFGRFYRSSHARRMPGMIRSMSHFPCFASLFPSQGGMQAAFLVFLGGGLGSLGRWLVGLGAMRALGAGFPFSTLIVNLTGGVIMGVLARVLVTMPAGGQDWRLFLMTGVLGGFTTFSAFSLDAATLWMRGEAGMSIFYVALSVFGSLAAVAAGLGLGSLITR